MADAKTLQQIIEEKYAHLSLTTEVAHDELTIEVPHENLRTLCLALRDEPVLAFDQLVDVCGVDYSQYGLSEWQTTSASSTGFERGVERTHKLRVIPDNKPRFAVVYHLLSVKHNHRARLRTYLSGEPLMVDSVVDIWTSANWNEREAYDLYGIIFRNHPDLRRILTDYGFIGHPFRKDFPLIGDVEMRYDAAQQRVIYEPVSIEPRVLVPKVIREDYHHGEEKNG